MNRGDTHHVPLMSTVPLSGAAPRRPRAPTTKNKQTTNLHVEKEKIAVAAPGGRLVAAPADHDRGATSDGV